MTPMAILLLLALPLTATSSEPQGEGAAETSETAVGADAEVEAPPKSKPVVALLPSISFNGDDGLGLGVFGDIEMERRPGEDRFYIWTLGAIARAWLKPPQVGWEVALGWSWFPDPDGATEISANVVSLGRPWDWWFGVGQEAARDERFNQSSDPVPLYWHKFSNFDVRGDVRLFRRLVGPVDVFIGGGLKATWTGVKDNTLLAQEVAAGLRTAPDGGLYGAVDGGLRIDGRDDRTDPTNGGFVLGYAQLAYGPTRAPWGRFVLDVRGYVGVPSGVVVFAGEVLAQAAVGAVPFYELGLIGGFEANGRTLVGVNGMRALDRGRLRGPLGLLAHSEVRFRPPGFQILRSFRMRVASVLWLDAARVDEIAKPFTGGPFLQPSFGWGFRLVFNEVTTARFDMGTSPERQITDAGDGIRWPLGFYGTVGHSF